LLLVAGVALAGPDDPSKFDSAPLGVQKAVYQFNYKKPEDIDQGLGYLTNYLQEFKIPD
jgi:uncharacterized protein